MITTSVKIKNRDKLEEYDLTLDQVMADIGLYETRTKNFILNLGKGQNLFISGEGNFIEPLSPSAWSRTSFKKSDQQLTLTFANK